MRRAPTTRSPALITARRARCCWNLPFTLNDGRWHSARVTYERSSKLLALYLTSDPSNATTGERAFPVLTAKLPLLSSLNLDVADGAAWVGFTAGTSLVLSCLSRASLSTSACQLRVGFRSRIQCVHSAGHRTPRVLPTGRLPPMWKPPWRRGMPRRGSHWFL